MIIFYLFKLWLKYDTQRFLQDKIKEKLECLKTEENGKTL